jgi:hypothetical protein
LTNANAHTAGGVNTKSRSVVRNKVETSTYLDLQTIFLPILLFDFFQRVQLMSENIREERRSLKLGKVHREKMSKLKWSSG